MKRILTTLAIRKTTPLFSSGENVTKQGLRFSYVSYFTWQVLPASSMNTATEQTRAETSTKACANRQQNTRTGRHVTTTVP
jgi:hypothetical protein